jgi:hypothetical protein
MAKIKLWNAIILGLVVLIIIWLVFPQRGLGRLMDFGDAPDVPYGGQFPSLRASLGARHQDVSKFFLGDKADTEPDSHQVDLDSPNPAIGPDDGWDWVKVKITNKDWPEDQPMYLNVLDDKDNNLSWDVEEFPEEHLVTDQVFFIPKGQSVFYNLPEPASGNWIRFTLTDIPLGSAYDGSWAVPFKYGETEDYVRNQTPTLPPPFHIWLISHNTFWSSHIPIFTHWQVFTHIWHRSAPGIPKEPEKPTEPERPPTPTPRTPTPKPKPPAPTEPEPTPAPAPTPPTQPKTYPDYNLTGTHERATTREITIKHNTNDTKYYYPDGTVFDEYEAYDIPRP